MKRPNITGKKREQIFLEAKGKCVDCGKPCSGGWRIYKTSVRQFELDGTHEIHHIIPVRRGGSNEIKNLILLCIPCHRLRHKIVKGGECGPQE